MKTMTVLQLYNKLGKEIKNGDGHHEVKIWTWSEEEIQSVGFKFIHCANAVILEPNQKVIIMKNYLTMIKESFDTYFAKLKANLKIR